MTNLTTVIVYGIRGVNRNEEEEWLFIIMVSELSIV